MTPSLRHVKRFLRRLLPKRRTSTLWDAIDQYLEVEPGQHVMSITAPDGTLLYQRPSQQTIDTACSAHRDK